MLPRVPHKWGQQKKPRRLCMASFCRTLGLAGRQPAPAPGPWLRPGRPARTMHGECRSSGGSGQAWQRGPRLPLGYEPCTWSHRCCASCSMVPVPQLGIVVPARHTEGLLRVAELVVALGAGVAPEPGLARDFPAWEHGPAEWRPPSSRNGFTMHFTGHASTALPCPTL